MTTAHTSTSSPGSEDSPSQQMLLAGFKPESSASKTTTAPKSSTDIGPASQSSGTSETLTAASGGEPDCSQVDFHVNLSVKPGSDEARKMTVRSGLKCSELLKKQDPISCLQRTLLASSTWHSTMCFLNWKAKGTPQGRLYFQLAPSQPRTDETECGLWPTPSTRNDRKPDPSAGGKRKSGTPAQTHLQDAVEQRMWPTPSVCGNHNRKGASPTSGDGLATKVKMWPTPTANEDAAGTPQGKMQPMLGNHPDVRNTGVGTLNPTWVEWLMGYPLGHTDLKPSETPSSHK